MKVYILTLNLATLTMVVCIAMLVLMGNYGEPPVVEYPVGSVTHG